MADELRIEKTVAKTPRDVLKFDGDNLYDLLKNAKEEMVEVEHGINLVEKTLAKAQRNEDLYDTLSKIDSAEGQEQMLEMELQDEVKNMNVSPVGTVLWMLSMIMVILVGRVKFIPPIVIGLLFIIFAVSGTIIYIKDRNKLKGKAKEQSKRDIEEANRIYAETQRLIDNVKYAVLIPKNYRFSLALSTMMSIMENGRADNWVTLADKYEESLHRWEMEKSSRENLEYQRFIALQAEATAINTEKIARDTGRIARATTISAVIDISRLFW